jgi:hypothetical protein
VEDKQARDAEDVTHEMIEAGVLAYRSRDSRFMLDEDIVETIFIAMASKAPRSKCLGQSWEDSSTVSNKR